MEDVLLYNNDVYLSYNLLYELGIKKDTVWSWSRKNLSKKIDNTSYIQYDLIPTPTRSKLPAIEELLAKAKADDVESDARAFANYLRACVKKSGKYISSYMESEGVNTGKATRYAKKRAIIEGVLTICSDYSAGNRLRKGYLQPIAQAYREVAMTKTNDIEVSRLINNCKKFGIDYMVLDDRSGKNAKKFDDSYLYVLTAILSGTNNLNYKQAAIELIKACKLKGMSPPSKSWGEKKAREIENNIEVYANKFGMSAAKKMMPYAHIINATYADDQWQIDGYNLPFFCKVYDDKGKYKVTRLVLIAVKDTHSGRIVGYSIGVSENRYTLYEAVHDAYTRTGALPYEIVTDNHSYNLTEIVENFKTNAERIGMVWTVDSNPQRKAKVERGFKMLAENHLKQHKGYLGQGLVSKEKNGRVSPEMVSRYYSSKALSEEEVKLITASAILEFNATPYESQQLSPDQLYDQCTKPHRRELDIFNRVKLFTLCREYKVIRGQITIEANGVKYEYQLNAENIHRYNGKKVTVRFEDYDTIYLFDKKTDMPICSVRQKQGVHGSLVNQTEDDLDKLNKIEGRRKGVWAAARRELEDLRDRAEAIHPGISRLMEDYMMPKDVKKELEENEMLRHEAERMEINRDRVAFAEAESHLRLASLKTPAQTKREKQPFAPKNHKISIIKKDEE